MGETTETTENIDNAAVTAEKETEVKVSLVDNYDEPGRLRDKRRKRKVKIISILSFIGCMLLFIVVMAASVGL